MSVKRSIGVNTTSPSGPMSNKRMNEPTIDPSNVLYNDTRNYQIIFTNDSRFFDTSLHLFKSYRKLGYIELDNKKSTKSLNSSSSNTVKSHTNGTTSRWRPKPVGFSSNDLNGKPNGTLNSPSLRHYDYAASYRSESGISKLMTSKIKRENSPFVVSSQRSPMPSSNYSNMNDDDSDDPDIIVTRL
ncbi:unnamed protein product [Adineta steineri]|uniref:Uncharacterized protein n=1 Tax=Adineta steineri TaxID=433720 RepID=A0A813PXJ1_9BILA|nr:unnamed protein product [Adineta steineri]CAF0806882.1 unnamed protein product [Adineta steineri]CAF3806354.1 unnamed protein product [Adineta steineri]CAF3807597.1 unnamed protein product [Adineta steineri]CAF3828666.1 unnamed protein product [Adineta steineri]